MQTQKYEYSINVSGYGYITCCTHSLVGCECVRVCVCGCVRVCVCACVRDYDIMIVIVCTFCLVVMVVYTLFPLADMCALACASLGSISASGGLRKKTAPSDQQHIYV